MPYTTQDIIFLGLPLVIIVFFIYAQLNKNKKHRKLIESLKANDKVVTMGGLVGRIEQVKKDVILLRIDEKTKVEVLKDAIYQRYSDVVKKG